MRALRESSAPFRVTARQVELEAGYIRVAVHEPLPDHKRLLVRCQGFARLSGFRQEDCREVETLREVELEVSCSRIGFRQLPSES